MNQSAIIFKRNSKNSNFKNSTITKKRKSKCRKSLNSSLIIEHPGINNNFGEDRTLSKAYKNVIKVITNILENIEEQKINGKANNLNINSKSQRKRESEYIKRTSKKNLSIRSSSKSMRPIANTYKKKDSLSNMSKKSFNSKESSSNTINNKNSMINNKNSIIPIIKIIKLDNKENSNQKLFNNSYNKIQIDEINNSINSTKLNTRNFPKFNDILKIEKKRLIKHHSNKIIPKKLIKELSIIKKESSKNSIILYNEDDNSICSSSFASLNSRRKVVRKSLTKNNKSLHLKIKENLNNQKSTRRSANSRSLNLSKNIETTKTTRTANSRKSHQIQKKFHINNIHKKLYNYENNEITDAINKLPSSSKENKQFYKKRKNLIFTKELKEIIDLNPDLKTILKHFEKQNKEKNFRCLLFKGNVYDSLNDDEESEIEIDEYFCYFEPNSKFLYVIDSIMFISSLIILLYLPFYLAKNLYFCQNIFDINSIMFYLIDFFYIIDLAISFYRSYYNFDEYLVKQNLLICINYFKTWFLLDLISAIPIFSILKSMESKCIGINIYKDIQLNNGNHSHYYNTNPHNIHYLLVLIKVIKTLKIIKKNIAVHKIGTFLCGSDFLTDWGNVILYSFFLLSFLNLSSCLFIFIGRNSFHSWIYLDSLEIKSFFHIYIGAIYYLIATVTTVGYGDLIGKNIKEIVFQVINLIAGTCIYSWLISSISNYIQKMNGSNSQYEKKLQILEEIKLNNPHLNNKLYDKILRLLHYRKYHEDETEKNIVLNSLPNSLKNSLIIEMYKKFINDFIFFRGIDNKEFIVQIISKLKPIIGIKGDTLIKEGEYIDDIIFIKDGILSLEICIDLNYPEQSIEQYLTENGYIQKNEKDEQKIKSDKSSNKNLFFNKSYKHVKTTFGDFYYGLIKQKTKKYVNNNNEMNKSLKDINNSSDQDYEIEKNIKRIKILDIRKNEHFGDVLMFLNKKSPLCVRVRTNKADLLLLKKLDALKISTNYPNIWKRIIKKPLANSKLIKNLTFKMLATFCNYHGIKTNLFKKRKKNKEYPPYYLKPVLYSENKNSHKKKEDKLKLLSNLQTLDQKDDSIVIYEDKSQKNNSIIVKNNENKENNENNENNQKYKSDITNEDYSKKNILKIKFDQNYKEILVLNNEINNYKSKTYDKNNNNLSLFNLHINKRKTQSLSYDEQEKKVKNLNNNNLISSFSFNNSKIMIKNNFSSKDNKNNNLSSTKSIYKPTLFKKSDKNINNNEIPYISEDKNLNISNNLENLLNSSNNKSKYYEKNNDIENLEFKSYEINDEIYPGENFIIKTYENEKPKNLITSKKEDSRKIITDKIYINNYNIIKTPCYKAYYNNNYNIQNQNIEINNKRTFENLKISSSISTLKINSSYENINTITNHRYISNSELKKKTKIFLLEECKQIEENLNSNITSKKKSTKEQKSSFKSQKSKLKSEIKKIPTSIIANNNLININKNKAKFSSTNSIFDPETKIFLNKETNKYEKNDKFHKLKNKKMSSSISLRIENKINSNLDYLKNIHTIKEKKLPDFEKNIILEEKIENSNDKKSIEESVDNSKRRKNKKEMEIISLNIKKSSQNLNQPDLFYADLFSHLIRKDNQKNLKNKNLSSSKLWKNIDINNISERNEIQELDIEE